MREALGALDALEAQLEAIGAGGVSGPLVGRASLSANAGEPRKVFLVATGEEHEGEATYTRYDYKPPPLCDSECLFAAPPTAQAEGLTWTVFNSGAQVVEVESLAEAMEYLTPARLARQWCAVCVVDQSNLPPTSAERVEHG